MVPRVIFTYHAFFRFKERYQEVYYQDIPPDLEGYFSSLLKKAYKIEFPSTRRLERLLDAPVYCYRSQGWYFIIRKTKREFRIITIFRRDGHKQWSYARKSPRKSRSVKNRIPFPPFQRIIIPELNPKN